LGKKDTIESAAADIYPTLGNEKPSTLFTGDIKSYQTMTWTAGSDKPVYESIKTQYTELMEEGASVTPNSW